MLRLSHRAARAHPGAAANDRQTVRAARGLNRASGLLATSVLLDSAVEHYRGSFHNKAMYAPLAASALSILAGAHGHLDRRGEAHRLRDGVYLAAALTGLIGSAAHLYNVAKRPGGVRLQSLFYSAPIGAPAALVLSGLIGFLAERTRANAPGRAPKIAGLPAGRFLAAITGAGLIGTSGEAGLLHYRGAFQNPFMLLPITLPPIAAALMEEAAFGCERPRPLARWWLRATSLLGAAGVGFHIIGVSRAMGGWRNWRQNMVDGPPIPAPPSFTGLALAGLAALGLMERDG